MTGTAPWPNNLFVLSGPSGVGKSTLIRTVLDSDDKLRRSISHTSRRPRIAEINGCHYHFVATEQFLAMRKNGEFLETVNIFGNYYGTSRNAVETCLNEGHDTVLVIDWQGAREVRTTIENVTSIFVLPPSMSALQSRLHVRAEDDPEVIAIRVQNALNEMAHCREYDYVIVNGKLETAVEQLHEIIEGVRSSCKVSIGPTDDEIDEILATK